MHKFRREVDQAFLMNEVWPLVKDHLYTHDTCYQFHVGSDFPSAYCLPRPVHVGGGKTKAELERQKLIARMRQKLPAQGLARAGQ